jgi:hypothetical protein
VERRCILKEMIELRRAIRALMREARATVATFSDGKCHSHAAGRSVIRITSISLMKCDREKRMIDEQRRRGGYNAELLRKSWIWQGRAMRGL